MDFENLINQYNEIDNKRNYLNQKIMRISKPVVLKHLEENEKQKAIDFINSLPSCVARMKLSALISSQDS